MISCPQIFRDLSLADKKEQIPRMIHSNEIVSPLSVAQEIAAIKENQGIDDPFFVMNLGQVYRQHANWLKLLPRVEPHYAVKCNNDATLLRILASMGLGFDCASKQEIESVMEIEGMTPERIIYANPCKTRNYIRHAAMRGIKKMTFDNEEELYKIQALFPDAELVLRIAVADLTAVCQLNFKFGCDPVAVAPELLQRAALMKLKVIGISFHVGSGCRDPSAFSEAIAHAGRLFQIGKEMGHDMTLLDIGGGYPGFDSDQISFPQITGVINKALDVYFPDESGVRVIAEPGRYYAAAAFTLVCNVIAKTKVAAGKVTGKDNEVGEAYMYYINDGVYGSFNCILYDHFSPTGAVLFQNENEEKVLSAVWGPTCDGLDLVLPQCYLPRLQEGSWMVFENMGAYTCAAGSEFNGFPRPCVYYHTGRKIIVAAGSVEEVAEAISSSNEDEDQFSVSSTSSSIVSSSDETE